MRAQRSTSVLVAFAAAGFLAVGAQPATAAQTAGGGTDTLRASAASCTPTAPFTGCQQFAYTGSSQTFTAPARAIEIKAVIKGGGGGGSDAAIASQQGGAGGTTTATMPVEPGESLTVTVAGGGKAGSESSLGGYKGGGHGGRGTRSGGGGGGMSGLWKGQTALAIAGGGGGAGGGTGQAGAAGGAGGGTAGAEGTVAASGGGGTQSAGGVGGTGTTCTTDAEDGVQFKGGKAAFGGDSDAGGGGGAGWYGGGGGGCAVHQGVGDAGGGGGSGYVNHSAHVTGSTQEGGGGTAGTNQTAGGNGSVKIQWRLLEPPKITGPADGGSAPGDGPIKGTGEPDATVTVKDKDGNTLCTAKVDAHGNWHCTPTKLLPCGPNELTATQKLGDVTSEPEKITFTVTKPCIEAPKIISAPPASSPKAPVKGTSPVHHGTVTVRDENGNVVCTAKVPASGKWSCTPKKKLPYCTELTATLTVNGVTSRPSKPFRTYCPPKWGMK